MHGFFDTFSASCSASPAIFLKEFFNFICLSFYSFLLVDSSFIAMHRRKEERKLPKLTAR